MDKIALRQAWERLHAAQAAYHRLAQAQTFSQMETAWNDFLAAGHTIFNKLQKGTKGAGPAAAWFGRVKHERKTDPLLRYVHHARSSAVHGIEEIIQPQEKWEIKNDCAFHATTDHSGRPTFHKIESLDPNNPARVEYSRLLKLVRVHDDEHGDDFEPPTEHLGKRLSDDSALGVAKLALQYFDRIVRDGSKYAK